MFVAIVVSLIGLIANRTPGSDRRMNSVTIERWPVIQTQLAATLGNNLQ